MSKEIKLVKSIVKGLNEELNNRYKKYGYSDKDLFRSYQDVVIFGDDMHCYGGNQFPLDEQAYDTVYEKNKTTLTKHIKIMYNAYISNEMFDEHQHLNYTTEELKHLTLEL